VFAACFLLLSLFLVSAQEQAPQQVPPPDETQAQEEERPRGFRIGVDVNQVFLSVNARSQQGGFLTGLQREDFQVVEDGVKQEIVNFYGEEVPLHVVLLIDISGSTQALQSEIRRAAMEFAKRLKPEDRVAVVAFSNAPVLIQDWTSEMTSVETALRNIYAKGMTVLNDALYVVFDDLLKGVEGKRAVILFTDGVDTASTVNFDSALQLGVQSEALVYVVSKLDQYWSEAIAIRAHLQSRAQIIPKELSDDYIISVKRSLERLCYLTGGRFLDAKAFATLDDVYTTVAEELRNQYYLSYIPSNVVRDGAWRTIEVRVNRPGSVATTRPGYFAPGRPAEAGGD
jgi:Ca-activated chloride channel homolog